MIKTWQEVEDKMSLLSALEATVEKEQAILNKKIAELTAKAEESTMPYREKITAIKADMQAFCLQNEKEFKVLKSKTFAMGKIGFRTSPPKVTVLNRKYTFKTALELIERIFPGCYVRSKKELDKEAILADYAKPGEGKLTDARLAAVGLMIDQEELFFVELNKVEILGE